MFYLFMILGFPFIALGFVYSLVAHAFMCGRLIYQYMVEL